VSATFPREVRALADSVQSDPAHVEGTPLGAANTDIEHVIHLVSPHDRRDAIVNLLLAHPDEQTLIFARTRAEVGELSASLGEAGFRVTSLSGEMDQNARTRALSAFKRGDLGVLVATDVAARGIDVQDITRVIHAEPPNDADTYTHRSGRTGRAGRKGSSAMLVPPAALARAKGMLSRARITPRVEPVPGPDEIRRAPDERVLIDLTRPPAEGEAIPDARVWALAGRIVTTGDPTTAIARLLARARYAGPAEPRAVRSFQPPPDRAGRGFDPRDSRDAREPRDFRDQREQRAPRTLPPSSSFVPFRVTWGAEHGADARRLLALVCRRGNVRGNDIGAIRVARTYSVVEVAETVAAAFEAAALAPDPRDPRVRIHPDTPRSAPSAPPVRFVPAVPPARRSAPVVVEVEHAPAPAPARAHPPAPREYAPPAAPARSGPSRGHFAQAPRTPGPKRSGDGPPRAYGHTGPKRPATNDAPRATAEAPKRGGDEPPRRPRRIVTGR
jgi:ATP-dependent RNA helicase DeaD